MASCRAGLFGSLCPALLVRVAVPVHIPLLVVHMWQANGGIRSQWGGCDDRSILLTQCADGVGRLWSVTDLSEGGLISLCMCATLGLDGLPPICEHDFTHRGDNALPEPSERSFKVVQWLRVCEPSKTFHHNKTH